VDGGNNDEEDGYKQPAWRFHFWRLPWTAAPGERRRKIL